MTRPLDPVHREVARFLREHAVPRSARLLAAVSGGSDSVALLHVLLSLGQRVGVAHVHHGLRGAEADRECEFVADLCRAWGVRFDGARVDARRRDARSPEARARELRYQELERLRREGGYASLVTAHQQDDQAETVLLRALRGTGPRGLAAIRPALDAGRVLRPLLRVRRAALAEYLARRQLPFASDSSNTDRAIPRNRLRLEVVPALEAIAPAAVANLARLADLARAADDAVVAGVAAALERAVEPGEGGLWIDRAALLAREPELLRQILAELAIRAGISSRISRALIARAEVFARESEMGQRVSLPAGRTLYRDRTRLWLGPAPGPVFPSAVSKSLAAGEVLEFPERRLRLSWHDAPPLPSPDPFRMPAQLDDRFTVRSLSSLDRVTQRGRERRLKDVLASARWSKLEQARALVVEREGEIVWVPGLRPLARSGSARPPGCEIRASRLSTSP